MPRSAQTFSLRDALLEQARREMLRRKQTESKSTHFPEWLKEVSPDFTWDWSYLQYSQAHPQKVETYGKTMRRLRTFLGDLGYDLDGDRRIVALTAEGWC
jgi:hypothetical protein